MIGDLLDMLVLAATLTALVVMGLIVSATLSVVLYVSLQCAAKLLGLS